MPSERSMERIIVTVGQGFGPIIAREALAKFAQYGCSILYQEDSRYPDMIDTIEIYADYITIKVEEWLNGYYLEDKPESKPIRSWERHEVTILE